MHILPPHPNNNNKKNTYEILFIEKQFQARASSLCAIYHSHAKEKINYSLKYTQFVHMQNTQQNPKCTHSSCLSAVSDFTCHFREFTFVNSIIQSDKFRH